jgi:nickel-dependent lactate racemase
MDVELPYGPGRVTVRLPAAFAVEIVAPAAGDAVADERAVLDAALDAPVGSPRLEDLARGATRVTIVVPDATRPARTPVVVGAVLDRLARAGVPDAAVTVLVGGGIHAPPSLPEVAAIVGPEVAARVRLAAADAGDAAGYADLPPDRALKAPRLHRAVLEAGLVVVTGAVAPHYLAGFSGGGKGLVIGCGDRGTVEAAHRLTLDATVAPDGSLRPRLGRPEGNPFAATLLRVARSVPTPTFLVNVGLADGRVAHAAAGEVGAAHETAWTEHRRRFAAPRPAPADLVIAACGPGRDGDLVQAHKALVVAAEVAAPGAPIVWLAHAAHGAGHPRFLPWFEAGRLERHLFALRREFHPYGLTAYALRWKAARHPVHVVSVLPRDVLRPMGLWVFDDAQAAVDHALATSERPAADARPGAARPARCVVLPRAADTFFG